MIQIDDCDLPIQVAGKIIGGTKDTIDEEIELITIQEVAKYYQERRK